MKMNFQSVKRERERKKTRESSKFTLKNPPPPPLFFCVCYSASRSETKELFSSGALFIVAKEARETVYNVNELSTFLRSCLSIEEKLGERERERERKKHH